MAGGAECLLRSAGQCSCQRLGGFANRRLGGGYVSSVQDKPPRDARTPLRWYCLDRLPVAQCGRAAERPSRGFDARPREGLGGWLLREREFCAEHVDRAFQWGHLVGRSQPQSEQSAECPLRGRGDLRLGCVGRRCPAGFGRCLAHAYRALGRIVLVGLETIASTNAEFPALGPDAGGMFTVTVTPSVPSAIPFADEAALAADAALVVEPL